jgi:GT2 family glycosyltransferase
MEWNLALGEIWTCGGDALLRLEAFDAVGGYDDSLIAGEEPDMCLRMREAGYRVLRIDREMTRHDAAMTRFEQWWTRNVRAGHACAEGFHRHPEHTWSRVQLRANLIWGIVLPATILGLGVASGGVGFLLIGLYGVSWLRIRRYRMRERKDSSQDAGLYATYCVLGKLPQALGAVKFHWNRLRGRRSGLIEYKRA